MTRGFLGQALSTIPDVQTKAALYELARTDPYLWTLLHRRLKGKTMVYDVHGIDKDSPTHELLRHRPFLIQPLVDQHPHKCYKKARQVGVSELAITEVFAFLDSHEGTKWVFTFPRDTQLKDFSVTRISEAIAETPAMRRMIGIPNQVYTKRIGESFMILRSAWESNLGEGIDADGVTLDEKDRMKEGVDVAFRESLASSPYGYLREVSTPTLPGRGIDVPYINSCQYEWFVQCMKCKTKQSVRYPENIIQLIDVPLGTKQLEPDSYGYRCWKEKCRGELNRLHGEWVPKFPSRSHIAAYWIPQTICPWIGATKLMQKKIDYRYAQLWENYCLGATSATERHLVSEDDFHNCDAGHDWKTSRGMEWARVSIGIDWGNLNWGLAIGINAFNNLPYLIGFFVCEDEDANPLGAAKQMAEWLAPFQPDIIVADAGYGKDRNAYLLRQFGSKFYACYYNPSPRHSRTFQPQFNESSAKIVADRTITLKGAVHTIRDNEIGLPKWDRQVELICAHFRALAPMKIEEDGEVYEIIDKTGDDHLAHTLGYALLGSDYVTRGFSSFNVTWE